VSDDRDYELPGWGVTAFYCFAVACIVGAIFGMSTTVGLAVFAALMLMTWRARRARV